jgi:hypothetical protein
VPAARVRGRVVHGLGASSAASSAKGGARRAAKLRAGRGSLAGRAGTSDARRGAAGMVPARGKQQRQELGCTRAKKKEREREARC